jgi:hypothetical protein
MFPEFSRSPYCPLKVGGDAGARMSGSTGRGLLWANQTADYQSACLVFWTLITLRTLIHTPHLSPLPLPGCRQHELSQDASHATCNPGTPPPGFSCPLHTIRPHPTFSAVVIFLHCDCLPIQQRVAELRNGVHSGRLDFIMKANCGLMCNG